MLLSASDTNLITLTIQNGKGISLTHKFSAAISWGLQVVGEHRCDGHWADGKLATIIKNNVVFLLKFA